MNDEQIIAEVCKKCGLDFTLGDLEALTELCRNYYNNRRFLENNQAYHSKSTPEDEEVINSRLVTPEDV